MSQKIVEVEGVGRVLLAKRRGSRNLRLSIRPDGTIRVGLPAWAPYAAGVKFAYSRRKWIADNRLAVPTAALADGQRIGKSFRLRFTSLTAGKPVRTRVAANSIVIQAPQPHSSPQVQSAARKACERALKMESEQLLALRLKELAAVHGFAYKDLKIKRLTSRWGSCTDKGHISLSYYLVQLPWRLIDYVILHELAHTRHPNHSAAFWKTVESVVPDAKQLRSEVKAYRPVLTPA